jgi:hypothetical protein
MKLEELHGHGWSPNEAQWPALCEKFSNLKVCTWRDRGGEEDDLRAG